MKAIHENLALLDPNMSRLGGGGIKKIEEKKVRALDDLLDLSPDEINIALWIIAVGVCV